MSVPLPFSTLSVYPFADYGMAQLVVKNWLNPSAGAWLKQFASDEDTSLGDVARRKNPLLSTWAPREDIAI